MLKKPIMNHELFELHQSIAQHLPSGFASGPVELQYEVSHAGEVDSLRVLVDGVNIVNHLEGSVIAFLDAHCLESYQALYAAGDIDDGECPNCAGTGEGQFEGARCGCCRGRGSRK